mgnify:CR=1 FL=1
MKENTARSPLKHRQKGQYSIMIVEVRAFVFALLIFLYIKYADNQFRFHYALQALLFSMLIYQIQEKRCLHHRKQMIVEVRAFVFALLIFYKEVFFISKEAPLLFQQFFAFCDFPFRA